MAIRIAMTAGLAVLALAGCKRGPDPQNALYQVNSQTGVMTTKQGVQIDLSNVSNSCMTPEEARQDPSSLAPERARAILSCTNAVSVRQINAQLPRSVDPVTQMVRVSSDGPSVTYHFSTTIPAASVTPAGKQQLESQTRRLACSQPPLRQAMAIGGTFTYRYVDSSGALMHEFTISSC